MILIFEEPDFSKSVWCAHILSSLVSELKLKRLSFRMISSLDELRSAAEGDFVFLIASESALISEGLKMAERADVYPILLNDRTRDELSVSCSMVCSDLEGSLKYAVDELHASGRSRIALYGVNPRSVGDLCRRAGFLKTARACGSDVFFNNGSLENCFSAFYARLNDFDAAICANDFAAISLVRKLSARDPAALEGLAIIGCAETRLTGFYADRITSLRRNFAEYGKAAVALLDTLRKTPFLSRVEMFIRWDIDPLSPKRSIKSAAPDPAPLQSAPAKADAFYEDGELREMLCIEQLLNACDALDRQILRRTLAGESYEAIAEHCFVNVSTVKYRLRKMIGVSGLQNRAELVRLTREYLPSLLDEEPPSP